MNTLKPGDLVRYIDDVGEGRVIRILKNGMVEIRTPDGWDIPVYANRLVYIPEATGPIVTIARETVGQAVEKASEDVEKIEETREEVTETGIFLAAIRLLNEVDQFDGIRLALVNDMKFRIYFAFYELEKSKSVLAFEDSLDEGMVLELGDYALDRLSRLDGFALQGILIGHGLMPLLKPVDFHLPFQIKKFSAPGAYRSNVFFDEPAQLFRIDIPSMKEFVEDLSPADLLAASMEKEMVNTGLNRPKQFKSGNPDRIPVEIDLHINKLVDHVVGLTNSEILKIQMDKFRNELESAIIDNEREIIFIHGIGNGTLKSELRKAVDDDYPFCSYQDASYKDYGFGATRILIRQNKKI